MALGRKTGGRKKGVQNKLTPSREAVKDFIAKQLSEYYETGVFTDDLSQLSPRERVAVMERYTQYILPKQQAQRIEATTSTNVELTFREKLANLAKLGGSSDAMRIKPEDEKGK